MRCWSCGVDVGEGSRFCSSCGQDLQLRRHDERRVVTVLFADLVGFTTLSEHRDPEAVKGLVDRCFERLAGDIAAFGGRVDKFIGDGVLALFGAPVAHEDDAERAVRAAMAMQETVRTEAGAIGTEVQLRIGINTGEVLVGALRAGGDYTAMGDVVNAAQRLQTIADPGTVVVGAATYAATEGRIAYEALGERRAKGRAEPLECWRAIEATLPPGYRPRRVRAPLVGRDVELDLMDRVVDAAAATRRIHLLLLIGEAGVGKSRLSEEVARRAEQRFGARVLEGRCIPYGEANVWWPVAEALRSACGLDGEEPLEVAREIVREATADALRAPVGTAEVGRVAAGLVHLLGYAGTLRDVDPARAGEEATRSFIAYLDALAASEPVVLVLSDLHWADDAVLGLLDALLARAGRAPLVVLGTTRESLLGNWQPSVGHGSTQVLHLDPLTHKDAGRLLDVLAEGAMDQALREELLDHSGGNPFFLEELVALVSETAPSAADLHVALPETLRSLVAARLDHLDSAEVRVVQDAAVWGRRGPVQALVRMGEEIHRLLNVPAILDALADKDILDLDGSQWSFRSDSIRDVAYQRLTRADRAKRHYGIAAHLANLSGPMEDATDQAVSVIANHFATAAELVVDLHAVPGVPTSLPEEACGWLRHAAGRQVRAQRWMRAHDLHARAAGLVRDGSSAQIPFLLGAARALGELRRLEEAFDRTDAALRAADDDVQLRSHVLLVRGDLEQKDGRSAESLETLSEALRGFEAVHDRQGRADCQRAMGMAHLFSANLVEADAAISAALEAYRELGDRGGEAWALQNLAWISFMAGRTEEAERRIGLSAAMFTQVGDLGGIGWAFGLLAFVRFHQGRFEEAELVASYVLEESLERDDTWAVGMMRVLIGSVRLWGGRTIEAVQAARDAVEHFTQSGDAMSGMQSRYLLARALVASGAVSDGLAILQGTDTSTGLGALGGNDVATALLGAAVHLGDPKLGLAAVSDAALLEGDPSVIGESDQIISVALAMVQDGRARDALPVLANVRERRVQPSMYATAVESLALASTGDSAGAEVAAHAVLQGPSTYLDRTTALLALVAVSVRDVDASRTAVDALLAEVDATSDRVMQAIARAAGAAALCAAGADDAGVLVADGEQRLRDLGIDGDGWLAAVADAIDMLA